MSEQKSFFLEIDFFLTLVLTCFSQSHKVLPKATRTLFFEIAKNKWVSCWPVPD